MNSLNSYVIERATTHNHPTFDSRHWRSVSYYLLHNNSDDYLVISFDYHTLNVLEASGDVEHLYDYLNTMFKRIKRHDKDEVTTNSIYVSETSEINTEELHLLGNLTFGRTITPGVTSKVVGYKNSNNQLVGYLEYVVEGNHASVMYLMSIAGVGKKLLDTIDSNLVISLTSVYNSKLFYEKIGFEYDEENDEYVR